MTPLEQAGRDLAKARRGLATAFERAELIAIAALGDGGNESEVARVLGVDRMTVRKWAGKR